MEENNSSESHHPNDGDDNNKNDDKIINESNENDEAPPPPPLTQTQVVAPKPGQQWVPLPYHAAAMVMPVPHYPPHYMPYRNHHLHYHQYPPPPLSPSPHQFNSSVNGGGSDGENRTLWVGDLHSWMDEDYLGSCFASPAEVTTIKIIRNKQTRFPEGYGFVEFSTHAAAENILQSFCGMPMPQTNQVFRLNWATFGLGEKRSNNGSGQSIFVGDLAADVTDALLHDTFSSKYPSVKDAKVVIDANTGRSKGYGFVRFGDDNERSEAMTEMNGVYCSSRPMRIAAATPRKSPSYQQGGYSNGNSSQGSESNGESENTTIFVGGLDSTATDEDLRQPFSRYGEIVSIKIPVGKGCGFVQFVNRNHAEEALQQLNGTTIGNNTVRLSWGRHPANKYSRADYGNQWTGAYYGGPFVDGYGYAFPPPPYDPGMYAAGYGAYPMYGTHQQVS